MVTSDSEEEGEEVSEKRPIIDYAIPEKREPLTPTIVDWTLRIIMWAANAAIIIGVLFVLLTIAYYGLLMLFRSGD
jgi:hypothetical protein